MPGRNFFSKNAILPDKRYLLILALCALAVYANIFRNPFLWDDHLFILKNPLIQDVRNLPRLFTHAFFLDPDTHQGEYYRPFITLSFMSDYFVWKQAPFGYHLTNFIFHLLNTFLVYALGRIFLGRQRPAFWAALMFAIHPIQTEAVTYIPSRVDLIGTFFYLSSWLFFDRAVRVSSRSRLVVSVVLFCCALLSKEMTTTLPIILLCYSLTFSADQRRRAFIYTTPFWLLIFAYLAVRMFFIPFTHHSPGSLLSNLLWVLISSGWLVFSYLWLLIYPHPLYMERVYHLVRSFADVRWILFPVLAGLLGIAFWKLRGKKMEQFLLAAGLLALLPVLNIVPIYPSMAEHYLYIPSVAFFILAAGLFDEGWMRLKEGAGKKSVAAIGIFLFICYGARTVARNHDYRDETAFLEQTKRCAPWSPIVHNNLGGIYLLQGRTQEGLRELEQALALDPGNGLAWFNLGAAYCSAGMYDRALSCYQRSVERVPRSRSYNQMGILYGMQRRFPEAEEAFRQALSQDPDFADAYYNLGKVYWDQQRWAEVEDIWTQGLAKDPRHPAMKEWLERLRNTGVRKAQ